VSKHLQRLAFVVPLIVALAPGDAGAQGPPPKKPNVPLQLQVVMSRYQGEKKISSVPYTLSVNANTLQDGGRPSQLRMGARVPVPVMPPTVDGKPLTGIPTGGGPVTYEHIGTNIDCSANSTDDGRFEVNISIEDTSIYLDGQRTDDASKLTGPPIFRSFQSSNELILRDGQSTEFTAATDRISGEITKVEVTLRVMK
jgi:hypothetical protein